jgi:CRISPR-associated protein Cmr3
MQTLVFEAIDSLFFKDSRPHGAVGGTVLASRFPPPARTLMGAIRNIIASSQNVDWNNFLSDSAYEKLRQQIGDAEDFGQLRLGQITLSCDGKRLYPLPANFFLLESEQKIEKFQLGKPVDCDLGRVYLPEGAAGLKTLEAAWVDEENFALLLSGATPKSYFLSKDLVHYEDRIGIARDNARRVVKDGQLYQTEHLRLSEKVKIIAELAGAEGLLNKEHWLRLGAEGRFAKVTIETKKDFVKPIQATGDAKGIVLYTLAPCLFKAYWLPDGFTKTQDEQGITMWKGQLHGIDLTIKMAVIGKAYREGGWDLLNNQPRALQSYVPMGSAYYCETSDISKAISVLHGKQIGEEQALGRGLLAVGIWG